MTALEKVLRYTRSTKSRKVRLDAHFAKEVTHVLTRAELEEQLNAVPNQHKVSFLYLPSSYKSSQNLLAQTDFRSFDKVNANVEMENGVAKLVTQAVNGHHFLEESFAGASAAEQDVTIRVQAKANGKRYLMLQVEGNGENSEDAWIDLHTGEFFTRQTLPADFDGGAVAAFGLQQLSDDIGDNPITVVRSSDEAERDFTLDEITDGTLLSFVNEDVVKAETDFSTDTSGTGEGGLDRLANQSIGGRSGVLKGTIQATPEEHRLFVDAVDTGGKTHRLQTSIYIPSGQSGQTVDGFRIENGGLQVYATTTTKDTWVDIDVTWNSSSNSFIFIKFLPSGGSESWTGNGTDEVYIGDIVITQTTADGHIKNWRSHKDDSISADQTDIIKMPKIVDAGVLVEEGSKPAIEFDGVDDNLQKAFTLTNPVSHFVVAQATNSGDFVIDGYNVVNANSLYTVSTTLIRLLNGVSMTKAYTIGTQAIFSSISKGTDSLLAVNGSSTTQTLSTNSMDGVTIGAAGTLASGYNLLGTIQEVIVFASDQSANRKNIERKLSDIMERSALIEDHTDAGLINNITTIVGDDGWVDCFVSLKSVATTGIYRIGCSDEPKYKHYLGDGTGILLRKPQMYNGTVKRDFVPYNKPILSIESLAIVGSDLTIDRDSKATNVNRELLLEEVEADVPRFQFSEDGYEGHLIEGQGTNLFVFSDPDLEGRLGSRLNASLSLNDWGIGLFSNKVILDNTSGGALWYPNESVIIASGLPATICAFTRVIDGLSPTFGPNSNQGYFNVGGSTASAHYVTNLGNDIYFVYAHGISNGATNTGFLRWTYNAPGQIEITGMMLLEGHVHLTPSDYIPTNGAAATRLEERVSQLSYTPSLQWTLFVNCSDYQNGDISGDDQFRFRNANGDLLFYLWGLAQGFTLRSFFGDTSGNYYSNTTPTRTSSVVIRYDGAEINIFYSGVKVSNYGGLSITETQWSNLATFQIPRTDNTFNLKRMGVLPYAATDEQCQNLSAL